MRPLAILILLTVPAFAAELESRQLTTYIPQDFLETAIRSEKWTEFVLNVKGGTRKGDLVRIWTGGSIDRGNGERPGQNVNALTGPDSTPAVDPALLALSPSAEHAYALLFKTESPVLHKPSVPGKPLEIKLTKDKEKLFLGFNDERGRYIDNHLGKGRRHELDPAWVRVEVVRITVD